MGHHYRYFHWVSAQRDVYHATNDADGAYALIKSTKGWCTFCGGPLKYTLVSPNLPQPKMVYANMTGRFGVCRKSICKASAEYFKKYLDGYSNFPMAKILIEVTKNGDRTEFIRDIAQIASNYLCEVGRGRGVKKRSESHSPACAVS